MVALGSETRTRRTNTARRRAQILLAGRDIFLELGLENTRVEDICTRAKVSIGSFYHHFGAREILAGEIYLQALQHYLSPLSVRLENMPTARDFFRLMVSHHLGWVCENPDWARYLMFYGPEIKSRDMACRISAVNDKYLKKAFELIQIYAQAGEIRTLPRYLYAPLIIGPCQELSRQYLASKRKNIPDDVVNIMADVIWQGLKC